MFKKTVIKKKILHLIILLFTIIFLVAGGIFWFFKPYSLQSLFVEKFKQLNSKLFNPTPNNNYLILLNQLAQKQIDISYLNYLDEETVEASLTSGIKVTFSLKKDPIGLVTSLQLILSRFRIEGRKINKIDLRFKNPIVE